MKTLFDDPTHEQRAKRWIRENPQAFACFCRLALKYSRDGRRRISAKFVAEHMRWRMERSWNFAQEFKVNNNFTATMAREACRRHPVLRDAFAFRTARGGATL